MISTAGQLGTTHHLGLNLVGEPIKVLIEIPFLCISFRSLYPPEIQAISKTQFNLRKLKYSHIDLQEATASQKTSCPRSYMSAHLLPFNGRQSKKGLLIGELVPG